MQQIESFFLSQIIKRSTLGIINLNNNLSLTIKDPLTSILDEFKKIIDCRKSKNEGVWLGVRNIGNCWIGLSSIILRMFNSDLVHQAFMVDGHACSIVKTPKGKIVFIKIVEKEKNDYDWKYQGKAKRSIIEIMKEIEDSNLNYNFLMSNCQDCSDSLCKYALGIYEKCWCLKMVKNFSSKFLRLFGILPPGISLLLSMIPSIIKLGVRIASNFKVLLS